MYLFFAPYLAVGVIGYLWYRTSKYNERKESQAALLSGKCRFAAKETSSNIRFHGFHILQK